MWLLRYIFNALILSIPKIFKAFVTVLLFCGHTLVDEPESVNMARKVAKEA